MRKNGPLSRLLWPLLAFAGILLFDLLFSPGFFHIQVKDGHLFGSLIDIFNRGAPVALLALGMTLVIATGGVDLSVGAVMAISGALAALLLTETQLPLSAVIGISMAAAFAAGAWNGLLVSLFDIQPIVATLILMVAGRGIAQLISNGQIITFENPPFEFLGGGFFLGLPFPIILVVVALAVIGFATRATAMGLFIEATGDNATASRLAGVNTRLVKFFVYVVCGLCAGLAGLVMTSDIKGADSNNVGMYLELDAILAVVVGGTSLNGGRFSLVGSLIGAFLMQAVTTTILTGTTLTRSLGPQHTLVIKAIVIVIVCLLQSDSLRRMLFRRSGVKA